MLISATEMLRPVRPGRINPTRRITGVTTVTGLFTFPLSNELYHQATSERRHAQIEQREALHRN
jgi:hypothetical protein